MPMPMGLDNLKSLILLQKYFMKGHKQVNSYFLEYM